MTKPWGAPIHWYQRCITLFLPKRMKCTAIVHSCKQAIKSRFILSK
jgi:hypothetical protein